MLPKLATSLPSYLYVPLHADLQVKLTDNMSKEEVLVKNMTDLVSNSTKTDAAGNAALTELLFSAPLAE